MKKDHDKFGAYPEAEIEPGVTGTTQTVYDRDADVFGDESNAQVSSHRVTLTDPLPCVWLINRHHRFSTGRCHGRWWPY